MTDYITTLEAAQIMGMKQRNVQHLIQTGKLPATRIGRAYLVRRRDAENAPVRKPGRPRK